MCCDPLNTLSSVVSKTVVVVGFVKNVIWAMVRENLTLLHANNKGVNQTVQSDQHLSIHFLKS